MDLGKFIGKLDGMKIVEILGGALIFIGGLVIFGLKEDDSVQINLDENSFTVTDATVEDVVTEE
jgi:hypothetical protein